MKTGVVACGALALHVRRIALDRGWDVEIRALPPQLHNRPERIAAAVDAELRSLDCDRLAVAYADCGTYGALDEVLREHGAKRLQGDHCYDVFARDEVREALAEEPGTYFLTDFLVKTFDASVARPLRLPELRDDYFANYTRVALARPGTDARAPSPGRARGRADGPSARGVRGRDGWTGAAARATRRIGRAMTDFPSSAKAVVIGAGIVGNSMVHHLARLGWRDLVLLDKGALPNPGGSTGHASNFIFPVDHSKEMTALTRDSTDQYIELGVHTVSGGIEVARTQERLEEFNRRITSSISWGEPSELLTPAQVKELVPYINEEIYPRRLLHTGSRLRRLAASRHADARGSDGARRADDRRGHRSDRDRRREAGVSGECTRTRGRSRRSTSSSAAASGARGSRRWPVLQSRSRPPSTR